MRKRTKIAITVVVGVLALGSAAAIAGPLVYRDFFAAPAADAPTLMANDDAFADAPIASLDPADISGEWTVAEGSEAGYRVDEVLNGVDVTVTGRTDEVSGSVSIDGTTVSAAVFTVDVASIRTDNGSRDAYFRDSALRVGDHPNAEFRLTRPIVSPELPKPGESVEREVTGELTIAGVTREVTFTLEARTDGTSAEVAAQIPIVFSDFGVTAPDLGFVSVEDEGFVELQLRLER